MSSPNPVRRSGTDGGAAPQTELRRLVDHLIASGVHGLTPLGSTGEFAYLDWAQRRRIVEVVVEQTAGRVPVVAGVAATTTADAIRQAKEFSAIGANGLLGLLEAYFPVSEAGVVVYFTAMADATDLPVVLYTNPNFPVLRPLAARHRQAVASSAHRRHQGRVHQHRPPAIHPEPHRGASSVCCVGPHPGRGNVLIGGKGWMAGPACAIPRESVRLYELCRAQKWDAALTLQRSLWRVNESFAAHSLAAIKGALVMQGFQVGDPIPPQAPLSAEGRDGRRREALRLAAEALAAAPTASGSVARRRKLAAILGTIAAVGPFTTRHGTLAFPAVAADLNATASAVQGTLVTYFLALALGQLAYGPLSDRFGRRGPLLAGFVVYVLSSVGCALAQDIGSLTVLRFLQALGGCSGMVIARAVVRDVSQGAEFIRLMANLMMVSGIAPVIAPGVGSIMLGITGWRGIFGVLATYGAVVLALVLMALPELLPVNGAGATARWRRCCSSARCCATGTSWAMRWRGRCRSRACSPATSSVCPSCST